MNPIPNHRWKTVLVGVGGRGQWAVDLAGQSPRLEAVALVDRDPKALKHAASQLALADHALYDDLDRALIETGASAVIICTPMVTHSALCRVAFKHGAHVLVEKGMTFSWEEARELVSRAEEAGVRFCVAQNYRFKAPMIALREILATPSHPHYPGAPYLIDVIQHRYRPDPLTSTYRHAMIWDMSCHHMDFLIACLGPLARVSAHSYKAPWSRYEHDVNLTAFLEFESGAKVNYVLTHDARCSNYRLLFQGEKGVLSLTSAPQDPLSFQRTPARALFDGPAETCSVPDTARDVEYVLNEFLDYLDTGVEPGISGRQNLETMAACALLAMAADEKRTVERQRL